MKHSVRVLIRGHFFPAQLVNVRKQLRTIHGKTSQCIELSHLIQIEGLQ